MKSRCEHGFIFFKCTVLGCSHYDARPPGHTQRGNARLPCATPGCENLTAKEYCEACATMRRNARVLAADFDVEVRTAFGALRRCEGRIVEARNVLREEGRSR